MSTNFVDLVHSIYAAAAGGDLDLLVAHADPHIEVIEPAGRPGARTYRGHDGLVQAVQKMQQERDPPERFIDAGKERVIAVMTDRVDLHTGRDGKWIRWEAFTELDEVFAAIGLRKLKGES